jgi:hypothetical protein
LIARLKAHSEMIFRHEIIIKGKRNGRLRSTGSTRNSKCVRNLLVGRRRRSTGKLIGKGFMINLMEASTGIIFAPPNPMSTSNSSSHEGPLNSTSRFFYRIGADSAEETTVDAARARTARFM